LCLSNSTAVSDAGQQETAGKRLVEAAAEEPDQPEARLGGEGVLMASWPSVASLSRW
jgi:hypothetical protein